MQSIGQRLEEARKRQGISLREAAETTKVRSDFLNYFENDQFDFDLPDVYKIGFLKLYARYLHLDDEKLATDFRAVRMEAQPASSRSSRREGSGHTQFSVGSSAASTTKAGLGRIDLNDNPEEASESASSESAPTRSVPKAPGPTADEPDRFEQPSRRSKIPVESILSKFGGAGRYWKIAGIALGAIILVILVVLLVNALIRTEPADATQTTDNVEQTDAVDAAQSFTFRVTAPSNQSLRISIPDLNLIRPLQPGQTMEAVELEGVRRVIIDGSPNGALFEVNGRLMPPIEVGAEYTGRGTLYFSAQGLHDRAGNVILPLP
ncbi:MAG: helix-turn-helix domain-containing protein [Opitutales bacterium]